MKIIFMVGYLLFSVLTYAQKAPIKFGKIEESIVKLKTHSIDTSADAVVLMDYGTTNFRYDSDKGFIVVFERLVRIKILTKKGLKYGDFKTSYYHNSSSFEKVGSIKGYTYNNVGGKIIKSKLEKSSVYREETSDNWDEVKLSMPDVKQGSVIEFTYTLTSPFIWNLQTWVFQNDIPTVHSEYRAKIPDYFDYQQLHSGYYSYKVQEKSSSAGSITLQSKSRTEYGNSGATKSSYESQNLNFTNKNFRWVAKNIPEFKPESYVASPSDYLLKVEFELRGTQYPNQNYKEYMGTWESLNRSFLEHTEFGEAVKLTGYMNKELDQIGALGSDKEKVIALVKLIKEHIEWNDKYRKYASSTLRKAWTDNKGSTADINLMIVAGLKKLRFEAYPVLISTRGNGMIRNGYAISSQFNSVIALVQLEDGAMLLDGTDRFLPIGVLPKKCLNGKGWKVSKSSPGWIDINPTTDQEQIVKGAFDFTPTGTLIGSVDLTAKGYAGYNSYKQISLKGEDDFFEQFQNENSQWLIEEHEYDLDGGYNEPFKSKYIVELNEALTVARDRIYLNPTIGVVMSENPFKIEKREYPVDFAYPLRNTFIIKYTIPEGYVIEEMPKSTVFTMPANSAVFKYSVSKTGNELQIEIVFKINKSLFSQKEYPVLKQFYHQIVQKCEEQVVIKKNT